MVLSIVSGSQMHYNMQEKRSRVFGYRTASFRQFQIWVYSNPQSAIFNEVKRHV